MLSRVSNGVGKLCLLGRVITLLLLVLGIDPPRQMLVLLMLRNQFLRQKVRHIRQSVSKVPQDHC